MTSCFSQSLVHNGKELFNVRLGGLYCPLAPPFLFHSAFTLHRKLGSLSSRHSKWTYHLAFQKLDHSHRLVFIFSVLTLLYISLPVPLGGGRRKREPTL